MEDKKEYKQKETSDVSMSDIEKIEYKGTKIYENYINYVSGEKIQDSSVSQKSNENESFSKEIKICLE